MVGLESTLSCYSLVTLTAAMLYQSVPLAISPTIPPAVVVMTLNDYQDAPLTIIILATVYLSVVYGLLTLFDQGVSRQRWGGQILGARFPRRLGAIAQGWVAAFHPKSSDDLAHDLKEAGSH